MLEETYKMPAGSYNLCSKNDWWYSGVPPFCSNLSTPIHCLVHKLPIRFDAWQHKIHVTKCLRELFQCNFTHLHSAFQAFPLATIQNAFAEEKQTWKQRKQFTRKPRVPLGIRICLPQTQAANTLRLLTSPTKVNKEQDVRALEGQKHSRDNYIDALKWAW